MGLPIRPTICQYSSAHCEHRDLAESVDEVKYLHCHAPTPSSYLLARIAK